MTYSEAEILAGDQKSLIEVRRKRGQWLDFSAIWFFLRSFLAAIYAAFRGQIL